MPQSAVKPYHWTNSALFYYVLAVLASFRVSPDSWSSTLLDQQPVQFRGWRDDVVASGLVPFSGVDLALLMAGGGPLLLIGVSLRRRRPEPSVQPSSEETLTLA
mgnify:CR=1 FL=1